jgi:uncharacterized protein YndB with AHSA1/START domain
MTTRRNRRVARPGSPCDAHEMSEPRDLSMVDVPDRIERTIEIAAASEVVWALVSEPGWWINSGNALREHRREQQDQLVLVHDEEHGLFRVQVVALEPPRRAVFLWVPHSGGEVPSGSTGTKVEFTISEREGGVLLTVVETGFSALDLPADRLARNYEDNVEGWSIELTLAKSFAERS